LEYKTNKNIRIMILDIRKYPDKILTRKTKRVVEFDDDLKKIVDDLVETMYAKDGAGLAANQVGITKQVAAVDTGNGLVVLINPKIIGRKGKLIGVEGCLSFPGLELQIKRPQRITVKFLDKNGQLKTIKAQDLLARAICHEVDHLNGKTMLDRVSFWKRFKAKKNWKKQNFS
jgi:peptide deformylase